MRGAEEVARNIAGMAEALSGPPMEQNMLQAATLVSGDARRDAPVDEGLLRASLLPEVRHDGNVVEGAAGSRVVYAPFMELGTGSPAGNPPVNFPPPSALETWARRHGAASGYVVARAIWRRGGLEPRKFLQNALVKNTERIIAMIGQFVSRLIRR